MGITPLKSKNKTPISSIPIKCPKPQKSPIFHPLRCDEIARGVTAARWSGPEITCNIEARIAENSIVVKFQ